MNSSHAAKEPLLMRLLGRFLRPWVAIRLEPSSPAGQLLRPELPVCYVVERYGLSNTAILARACAEAGLPSPLLPIGEHSAFGDERALVALSRRQSTWFGRPRSRTHSASLAKLVEALEMHPDLDVQIVPVSIFVGRAPDRESGWFRVLFSENWAMVGRFRRALSVLLNGRGTIVQFASAVSLREALSEGLPRERTIRKVSRVLRAHFRRVRTAVIGPDLSHKRTLIDAVISAESVGAAIADQARRDGISLEQARGKARRYALEIAADYSHPAVRSASFILTPFWNKLYDGVTMRHFETLKQVAPGHEVIYVPSHRSHIDYLLLSYLLYVNGVVPPHIAAGVNLNLPIVGPILRRGGAFFLRRSFKANPLYSAVFSEYVASLITRGVSIEYFIEGGRSRTGRLLQPKAGMLVMTLRAFLRQPRRPVVFQPVYIGYEKVMEGKSYIAELSGAPKEKESLLGLLRAFGNVLRKRYGKVAVNFGQPIFLDRVLDEHDPDWRRFASSPEEKPQWLNRAVDDLSTRIQRHINQAADVNPVNLLALSLLATPKHAMAEADLLSALDLLKALLERAPYSERVTVTPLSPSEIVSYGESVQVLERVKHPLGDVMRYPAELAVLQTYYRNNVVHLFAAASWVACCFQNNRRMSRSAVVRLGRLLYPFVQEELFLPWTAEEFGQRIEATVDLLVERGLFVLDDTAALQRGPGQTDEVFQLRIVAHSLQQAFERYYIAIAVLVKNGSGTLSTGELENFCQLTAQRLSLLYSQAAPEFFDRALFRGFIGKLRELGLIRLDANSKLEYDERLEAWGKDARLILSRELRHSILKITPEAAARVSVDPAPAEAG